MFEEPSELYIIYLNSHKGKWSMTLQEHDGNNKSDKSHIIMKITVGIIAMKIQE
jgi:hypothetical protein